MRRFTPQLARYSAHIIRYADGKFIGLVRTPQSVIMRTITYTNASRPKFDIMKWYLFATGQTGHLPQLKWFSWDIENAQTIFQDADGLDHSKERVYQP